VTVTLNLSPELEAGLTAQARVAGKTLEGYLLSLAESVALPVRGKILTPEQRAVAYEAWSASHSQTQSLSDYAVSREGIYAGR